MKVTEGHLSMSAKDIHKCVKHLKKHAIDATHFILDRKNRCMWWINYETKKAGLHMHWEDHKKIEEWIRNNHDK